MQLLAGEYQVKVDNKGRVRLPADLLRQLPEDSRMRFVLNKGFDGSLSLYPLYRWNIIAEEMSRLSYFREKERQFQRMFFQGVAQVELDSNERLLIPKRLIDQAGITDEIVIAAFGQTIEIWPKQVHDKLISTMPSDFSAMADEVMGAVEERMSRRDGRVS
jgi:MraZ protein